MREFVVAVSLIALAGCGTNENAADEGNSSAIAESRVQDDNLADSMASNDEGGPVDPALDIPDPEERPIMQAQVVLDRHGFGPGVIDGKMGMSTENALVGFQIANDLEQTGELDEATRQALARSERIPSTRVVRIPENWDDRKYYDIPDETAEQAKMERLGYKSLDEKLAERFHTTVDVLKRLNPGGKPAGASGSTMAQTSAPADASAPPTPTPTSTASGATANRSYFRAGQIVRVPNIGADRIEPGVVENGDWQETLVALGVGTEQPEVDRIVVSKAGKTLKAYQNGRLVSIFTVSSGSSQYPLPLGNWDIVGEAYNPPYRYDPQVLSDEQGKTYTLPPGPNGPVGVVWIDLSKEHYGIHGTAEPETIGRAQSHGCVRLTNWDAARLAQMVSQSTEVEFVA